ncbi:MAG: 30S ribosomal protein S17 [SAR202 cluster bacterium Io17-Chloro-G2]|nr:MAG: 30S ribosomal protein S17 [SAR202 cluster bacterium Io17-Chloro-G2]
MAKSMRKGRIGSVVRTGREKTAVVEMVWKQRHRIYGKQMRRVARFQVHDPENQCRLGDVVRIEETRPISKTKHWRLMEILQRRQVADVAPIELESDAVISVPEPENVEETPVPVVENPAAADPPPEDSLEDSPANEAAADAPNDDTPEDTPANEAADAPEAAEDAPAEDTEGDESAGVTPDQPAEEQEEDETPPEAQDDEDGQR